ncbi:hypothetical protein GCM10007242_03920 [Pigmentiphaga litoralis]|nr:hypothetical protein GCM10007242_03920 [Pigmentiphaga litoralis]
MGAGATTLGSTGGGAMTESTAAQPGSPTITAAASSAAAQPPCLPARGRDAPAGNEALTWTEMSHGAMTEREEIRGIGIGCGKIRGFIVAR